MTDDRLMLPELPSGWKWCKLSDLVEDPKSDIVDGPFGSNLKASEYVDEGIPIIRLQNIDRNKFKNQNIRYITEQKAQDLHRHNYKSGDIVITKLGAPLGKACIVPNFVDSGVIVADVVRLRPPINNFNKHYIVYAINSDVVANQLKVKTKGTTRPRVNLGHIRDVLIPYSPLPEQERIVAKIEELFTQLDAGVTELGQAKAQLQRYRQAVIKSAVEGELTREWRQAHQSELEPAEKLLVRILSERRAKWEGEQWEKEIVRAQKKTAQAKRKAAGRPSRISDLKSEEWENLPDDEYGSYLPKSDKWKEKYEVPTPPDTKNLPELPEGWVWTNVNQLGDVTGGLTKHGSKRKSYPIDIEYLRVANVYANELRLDEIKTIKVQESELDRVMLMPGDLLIVEGNGSIDQIGRVAIWDGSIEPCAHQNHLIKVRFEPVEIGEYVLNWLLSNGGRSQIMLVASSTSGLYTLSLSKVSALAVPLPSLEEQNRMIDKIERRLSVADEIAKELDQALVRSERLRQSILKRAFEGRLV